MLIYSKFYFKQRNTTLQSQYCINKSKYLAKISSLWTILLTLALVFLQNIIFVQFVFVWIFVISCINVDMEIYLYLQEINAFFIHFTSYIYSRCLKVLKNSEFENISSVYSESQRRWGGGAKISFFSPFLFVRYLMQFLQIISIDYTLYI